MHLKSFTLLIFISLFLSSVSAQISILASELPRIGDQDRRIVVTSLNDVESDLGLGASDEQYQFNNLSGNPITFQRFLEPSEVDPDGLFSHANMARTTNDKLYSELLVKSDDGLKVIGAISSNPIIEGVNLKWEVDGEYFLIKTPLNYQDADEQNVSISSAMSSDFLPDSVLSSFPIPVDSFKFKYKIKQESTVDGYGKIYINDYKSMNVLRMKYFEEVDPRIEAYSGILKWMDVTDLIKGSFPELDDFLKKESTHSYRYYSDQSQFSLLEAESDASGVMLNGINYNDGDLKTFIKHANTDAEHGFDIAVNPNPSDGKVTMEVRVDRPGDYTVRVMSIIGYQLWSGDFYIYDKLSEELDFRNLRRGTYFYSLVGPNGKTLVTKRMLIIGA